VIRYYILDGRKAVPAADLMAWAEWRARAERIVQRTNDVTPGCDVSTVFLGIDYDPTGLGPPLLFETMVFGGPLNLETERYTTTWEQAEAGHARMVDRVRAKCGGQGTTGRTSSWRRTDAGADDGGDQCEVRGRNRDAR
jgi:hypothetical protein